MQQKAAVSITDLTELDLVLMFQATREDRFFNELFRRNKSNIDWQINYTQRALRAQHYGVDEMEAESAVLYAFLAAIDVVDVRRIKDLTTFKFAVHFNQKCKEYRYNRRTFHHSSRRAITQTVYVDAFEHYDQHCSYEPNYEPIEVGKIVRDFVNKLTDVEQVLANCLADGLNVVEAAKLAGRTVPSMRLIKSKMRRKAEAAGLAAYL